MGGSLAGSGSLSIGGDRCWRGRNLLGRRVKSCGEVAFDSVRQLSEESFLTVAEVAGALS
jgi:hypothetical protein